MRIAAAALGLTLAAAPGFARAAPAAHTFSIAARPLADALIDAAIQADASISLPRGGLAGLKAPPLHGRMTLPQALERLLAGSGYGFTLIDSRTVRIQPLPPRRPAPVAATLPATPIAVDEVLVIAPMKRREALERVPYAASALSGRDLEAAGVTDAAGVASLTTGLTVTNLGPGRDKLLIRGLSDGAFTGKTRSTVGIYLDDTQATYNAPDPDLKLVDIERVEVLRGPQGAVYGAGSIGGIYRVVTRKPDPQALSARVTAEGTATTGGAPGGAVDAALNLPLVPGHLALRAVGYWEQAGGYLDVAAPPRADSNRTVRQGFRLALRAEGDSGWAVTAGGAYQAINSADAQYMDGPDRRRHAALREPHDNDFAEAHVTVEAPTPWGDFSSTTSLIEHQIDSRYDASATLPLLTPGAVGPAAYDEATRTDLRIEEARLTSRPGGRLTWLVGLFASSGEQSLGTNLGTLGGQAVYSEKRNDQVGETALFGEVTARVWRDVSLTAGLRWFRTTTSVTSVVTQGALSRAYDGHFVTAGTSPKLVLSWRPSERFGAYLQAAQGYRVGGINTGGPVSQSLAGPLQPLTRYGGDRLWNYEAGARMTLLQGRLRLHAAVFQAIWRNVQTDQVLASGLPYTGNAGTAVDRGLEVESLWSPAPGLDVRLNLMLNDPELTHPDPGFPAGAEADLPIIAKQAGNLQVRYQRRLAGGLTGSVSMGATYLGRSGLTFDPAREGSMGGYGLANLRLGLEAPSWTLRLYLDNLTNVRADTFSYGNPFTLRTTAQSTPPRPRTVGAAFTWRY